MFINYQSINVKVKCFVFNKGGLMKLRNCPQLKTKKIAIIVKKVGYLMKDWWFKKKKEESSSRKDQNKNF